MAIGGVLDRHVGRPGRAMAMPSGLDLGVLGASSNQRTATVQVHLHAACTRALHPATVQ